MRLYKLTTSEGWLSGVYYVDVPKAVNTDEAGWLMFGGLILRINDLKGIMQSNPKVEVVLFPSYMWQQRFTDEHRLTVAFDIIPKKNVVTLSGLNARVWRGV